MPSVSLGAARPAPGAAPAPGGLARAVDPAGTVVQRAPAEPAPEPEQFASDNRDEARFRPVLRAPAPPDARPEERARPLPRGTTIPAQSLPPAPPPAPRAPPAALPTAVLIPAALAAPPPSCSLDKYSVGEAARLETDARPSARSLAPAERATGPPPDSLPKRPSGDIQPAARHRVRRSPTPKSDSDRVVSDDTLRDKKSSKSKGTTRSRDQDVKASKSSEVQEKSRRESTPKLEIVDKIEMPRRESISKEPVSKEFVTREPAPREYVSRHSVSRESVPRESAARQSVSRESIPKESISRVSLPRESVPKEPAPRASMPRETPPKEPTPRSSVTKEIKKPVFADHVTKEPAPVLPAEPTAVVVDTKEEIPSVAVTIKMSSKKKSSETKSVKEKSEFIKTEEQAWDMLLNEPEKPLYSSSVVDEKPIEEPKAKVKKPRKAKKSQDDAQTKDEESFVEIHAIEDKPQQSSGELVSISTPYEDLEPFPLLAKPKKTRSSKSVTPERKDQFDTKDVWSIDETELTVAPKPKKNDDSSFKMEFVEPLPKSKPKEIEIEMPKTDTLKVTEATNESTSTLKESPRAKKSKSLSPYADRKPTEKRYETDVKDVYVIDTMKEEFPEIQITKGTKMRKKSPQPEKSQEVEVVEKPIKSWSSIAASKNSKKEEKLTEEKVEIDKKYESESVNETIGLDEEAGSSTQVSLQDKLIELCKRTDIMVAECDAPSELNFVEEHHSVLDLPPLGPLDFGLDDFKLEVMRDSLLEINDGNVTSPICKINIDNILSTIKETTSKAIESSAFNLIDLEKVPLKKEKGFSVIENDKITSQEVKIDDDKSDDKEMEKSSDDDNTSPVVSTDSDKEEKKSSGASNVTMPSSKQSSKSKKARKKKK